ncbi:DUF2929 family protein [Bacillus lacus]|uniref:DUF2929 family protein n=1 Tax=Metabacillus lacus TaxID=1983721 RepID=A0A7X2LYD6_9BACI|nr:YjzD family protein [Metabacillus lacus]MRX73475.1 DUF2929 family protein [Metabacillus lacus]
MRYFWTLFWAFLLVNMACYVAAAMIGSTYDFVVSSILSVIATVLIIFIGELLPNEPAENHH